MPESGWDELVAGGQLGHCLLDPHRLQGHLGLERRDVLSPIFRHIPLVPDSNRCLHLRSRTLACLMAQFSGSTSDWIDWIVEQHIKGSDIQAALKAKRSIEGKMERARELYLDGDIDREKYVKLRDEAEKALLSLYVPEFDAAVEAGKMLNDFGSLWQSSSVERRNGMLKAMTEAVYFDPGGKRVVGLVPKKTFLHLVLAMAERTDLAVVESWNNCSGRNGGDGGESNSPSRRAHKPNVLQACPPVCSWTLQAPPAHPGEAQPVKSLAALTGVWLAAPRTYGA